MRIAALTWRRWAAGAGILFAACAPAFGFTPGHVFVVSGTSTLHVDASPSVISAYAQSHRTLLGFDLLGSCVFAMTLICFAALLVRLGRPGEAAGTISLAGLGAAVLSAALVFVGVAGGVVIVEFASPGDLASITSAWLLIHGDALIAPLPFATFVVASGLVILDQRNLPRWVGWFSLLVGAALFLDGLNVFILTTPLALAWPIQPGGLPATSAIWAFVVSLALLLERRATTQRLQSKPAC